MNGTGAAVEALSENWLVASILSFYKMTANYTSYCKKAQINYFA